MKHKNYFALYAFDEKLATPENESQVAKIIIALVAVLFSAMTLIAFR